MHSLSLDGLFIVIYIMATFKVISGWVPTSDSTHSWQLYRVAPLGDQAKGIMTWYPSQSHYPDPEQTSSFPILVMLSAWLGSDKYTFLSHWFYLRLTWVCRSESPNFAKRETEAQLIGPSCLVPPVEELKTTGTSYAPRGVELRQARFLSPFLFGTCAVEHVLTILFNTFRIFTCPHLEMVNSWVFFV